MNCVGSGKGQGVVAMVSRSEWTHSARNRARARNDREQGQYHRNCSGGNRAIYKLAKLPRAHEKGRQAA